MLSLQLRRWLIEGRSDRDGHRLDLGKDKEGVRKYTQVMPLLLHKPYPTEGQLKEYNSKLTYTGAKSNHQVRCA